MPSPLLVARTFAIFSTCLLGSWTAQARADDPAISGHIMASTGTQQHGKLIGVGGVLRYDDTVSLGLQLGRVSGTRNMDRYYHRYGARSVSAGDWQQTTSAITSTFLGVSGGFELEWFRAAAGAVLATAESADTCAESGSPEDRTGMDDCYFDRQPVTGLLPSLSVRLGPRWLHALAGYNDTTFAPGDLHQWIGGIGGGVEVARGITVDGRVAGIIEHDGSGGALLGVIGRVGPLLWLLDVGRSGGLGRVAVGMGYAWNPEPKPARAAVAEGITFSSAAGTRTQPEWPEPASLLRPGTIMTLRGGPLRVMTGTVAPQRQDIVCVVDEHAKVAGVRWLHLTCSPDLPPAWPLTWHTGCYAVTAAGVWRLPRCPADPVTAAGASAVLVVPLRPPVEVPGFIDIGARGPEVRSFAWKGGQIAATCLMRDLDGTSETCHAPGVGVVWSAWHWRQLASARPELGVALIDSMPGGTIDAAAPHLQFRNSESAICEMAPDCNVFGHCSAMSSACVARSDADCAHAQVCARWGHCHALAGGCTVASDDDCRRSSGCSQEGRCTARGIACTVGPADCASSAACRNEARCTKVDNRCTLTSDLDCRQSLGCSANGQCSLVDGECRARDDADCQASEACITGRRCAAVEGQCALALPAPPVDGPSPRR